MEEMTVRAINKAVEDMIKRNSEVIAEQLLTGALESDSLEKVYSKMFLNCVSLSTSIAVQAVIGLLQDAQILSLDEHQMAKLLLKQLSSEIKD